MAKYNRAAGGLGALLQGFAQGRNDKIKQNMLETELAWKNPDRPIGLRDLFSLMADEQKSQNLYTGMMPGSFQPQPIDPNKYINLFGSLQRVLQRPQGFDPSSGQPNPVNPTMQIQGLPGQSIPQGQSIPAVKTMVSRSGNPAQSIVDEMRKRGLVQ